MRSVGNMKCDDGDATTHRGLVSDPTSTAIHHAMFGSSTFPLLNLLYVIPQALLTLP